MITTAEQCKMLTDKNSLLLYCKITPRLKLAFLIVKKIARENFSFAPSFPSRIAQKLKAYTVFHIL